MIPQSFASATILENTSVYNYAHKNLHVVKAILKSTTNCNDFIDITKKMNDMIVQNTWMSVDNTMYIINTLTINSAMFNEYSNFKATFTCDRVLELQFTYSDHCVQSCNNVVAMGSCLISNITENTDVYGFSNKDLTITKAVLKTLDGSCIEVDVSEKIKKQISEMKCVKYLIIDSCKFNEYGGDTFDSKCLKYLDLHISYACPTICPVPCPTPCNVPCPSYILLKYNPTTNTYEGYMVKETNNGGYTLTTQ